MWSARSMTFSADIEDDNPPRVGKNKPYAGNKKSSRVVAAQDGEGLNGRSADGSGSGNANPKPRPLRRAS